MSQVRAQALDIDIDMRGWDNPSYFGRLQYHLCLKPVSLHKHTTINTRVACVGTWLSKHLQF